MGMTLPVSVRLSLGCVGRLSLLTRPMDLVLSNCPAMAQLLYLGAFPTS
jgi:hypothetical protein